MTLPKTISLALTALLLAVAPASLAGFGDGYTTGRLLLRPYVDASVGYDSNAQRTPKDPDEEPAEEDNDNEDDDDQIVFEEESDTYYELRLGTSFNWLGDEVAVFGSVYGFGRRYNSLDIEDEEGFGEHVGIAGGSRDRIAWQATQSFRRTYDFSPQILSEDASSDAIDLPTTPGTDEFDLEDELLLTRTQRDYLGAAISAGHDLTEQLQLDLDASYSQNDYDSTNLFNQSQFQTGISVAKRLTDKSSTFVRAGYGEEDNDNYLEPSPSYQALVGLRSATTAKLSYNLGVGYQSSEDAEFRPQELDDGTLVFSDGSRLLPDGSLLPPEPRINPVTGEIIEEPASEDDLNGIAYNAGISWTPTDKLGFQLSARNYFDSSTAGTQQEIDLVQFVARHRTTDSISLRLSAGYRNAKSGNTTIQVDDEGVETRVDDEQESYTLGARISYSPPQHSYSAYANATYEEISYDRDELSYDRLRVGVGMRVTY